MKGSYHFRVKSKRALFDFTLRRNITVIKGDSATGKTALVAMIREHFENGNASGVELTCDKECTVLDGRTMVYVKKEVKLPVLAHEVKLIFFQLLQII